MSIGGQDVAVASFEVHGDRRQRWGGDGYLWSEGGVQQSSFLHCCQASLPTAGVLSFVHLRPYVIDQMIIADLLTCQNPPFPLLGRPPVPSISLTVEHSTEAAS
jgi:hypothetical protein